MSTLRSMTGFGRIQAASGGRVIQAEIRSWNHKGLDIQVRIPSSYAHLESSLRDRVASAASRGKIILAVNLAGEGFTREVRVNRELLRGAAGPLKEAAAELGVPFGISLGDAVAVPGLVEIAETPTEDAEREITSAVDAALAAWDRTRRTEGEKLGVALLEDAARLGESVAIIESRAAAGVLERRERFLARVRELLAGAEVHLEEKRLELEVALLAEKADIREELVRLKAHLERLGKMLASTTSSPRVKGIGTEMGFLLQELLRETNTVNSKSQDLETIQAAVSAKTAIDRMKEQAANVV